LSFYDGGRLVPGRSLGAEFGSHADQKRDYGNFKQIPLRETQGHEQIPAKVQVKEGAAQQRDPTDVVRDPSDQLQSSKVAHGNFPQYSELEKALGMVQLVKRRGLYSTLWNFQALKAIRLEGTPDSGIKNL